MKNMIIYVCSFASQPTSVVIGLDHKMNLYTHEKCILANLHGSQTYSEKVE